MALAVAKTLDRTVDDAPFRSMPTETSPPEVLICVHSENVQVFSRKRLQTTHFTRRLPPAVARYAAVEPGLVSRQ